MVSTFTPNIGLEEPARGDDVGTWDTPVNNNMTLLDLRVGGAVVISLNNTNVTLSAAQFKCQKITFNSTLTGNVTITFPTSFVGPYVVQNICSGSSAFVITLNTTNVGGNYIALKPFDVCDIYNNGADILYRNLGNIGSYWEYAGSSVPLWVGACAIPPYLNCDGTSFSSATYPALTTILGGTTLPDSRGRFRANLNQGTGRITTTVGGLDGNTNLAGGGAATITLGASQIPTINGTISGTATGGGGNLPTNSAPTTEFDANISGGGTIRIPSANPPNSGTWTNVTSLTLSGTFASSNTGGGAHNNVPPSYVGGITMIRAG